MSDDWEITEVFSIEDPNDFLWYEVIDEFGNTISFCYSERHADLIAAAPNVVHSAETLLNLHIRALNGDVADAVQWDVAVLNLKTDIAKAKGETE